MGGFERTKHHEVPDNHLFSVLLFQIALGRIYIAEPFLKDGNERFKWNHSALKVCIIFNYNIITI